MFKQIIYFSIHFQTTPGQFIIVTGNHSSLGDWDVSKALRLDWNEGHIWSKNIKFTQNREDIEYKYVLCEELSNSITVIKWEEGPNRRIDFSKTLNLKIHLDDIWQHRKIKLRLKDNLSSSNVMLLLANISSLDEGKGPKQMELISKNCESYWQKEFIIPATLTSFKYHYIMYDKTNKKIFWEREKIRVMHLISIENSKKNKINESLSTIKLKNNVYKVYDEEFNEKFEINEIDENILVGPYPQSIEEIDILKNKGVKAVLNLQREIDMKVRKVHWEDLKSYYESKNMEIINFEINDTDQDDLTEKVIVAAEILNKLVKKYDRVYVHCTAGIIRAPNTVIAYLCLFKNFQLEKAIKLIKKKRPIAHLNKRCLEKALLSLNEIRHYISFI